MYITCIAVSVPICFYLTQLFNIALHPKIYRVLIWCGCLVFGFYHKSKFFGGHGRQFLCCVCAHVCPLIFMCEAYLNAHFVIRLVVCHDSDVKNDGCFVILLSLSLPSPHRHTVIQYRLIVCKLRGAFHCVHDTSTRERECNGTNLHTHTLMRLHTSASTHQHMPENSNSYSNKMWIAFKQYILYYNV